MSWNLKRSRDRVADNDFQDVEYNVKELTRAVDFAKLGPRDLRWTKAAHIYHDIPNFDGAVEWAGADKQKQKKVVRAASVLRKIQADLIKSDSIIGSDAIAKMQHQAARLHAIEFRPYDGDNESNEAKRAERAVVMGFTLNDYIYSCFNPVFSGDIQKFNSVVGVDSGRALIANLGFRGERERISLGNCANLAAKILNGRDCIVVTAHVYGLLRDSLKDLFVKDNTMGGVLTYKASGVRWKDEEALAEELGVTFDPETWINRTTSYRDDMPLDQMDVVWAVAKIDPAELTEWKSKRGEIAIIYADIDKFTKRVQNAKEDDEVIEIVRELQMIRAELHAVSQSDYEGVAVQHQGDRLLAFLNLPSAEDEHDERCNDGLDVAIGMQSSFEHVLREKMSGPTDRHLAIGVDVGTALVSRLGKNGKREVVCFGPEVCASEGLQLATAGNKTRISTTIYDAISDETKKGEFKKDGDSYVATGLTFPNLDELEEEAAARANTLGTTVVGSSLAVTSSAAVGSPPSFGVEG